MNKALFLDRDGVINNEVEYLHKVEDFTFIKGVFETCRYFQSQDYLIIIITNQSGIARGYYSEQDYEVLTQWMINQFKNKGVSIDAIYHCPHHPDFDKVCDCRKPLPGMILKAQKEFDIDLLISILVGDKRSDMEAAKAAGIMNRILVKTGHDISKQDEESASMIINSLVELRHWHKKFYD